jgi:hypothetical protein
MSVPQIPGTSVKDGTLLLADMTTGEFVATATANKGVLRDAAGDSAFHMVTLSGVPVNPTDVATVQFATSLITGLNLSLGKNAALARTTAALPACTRVANVITADANGILPAQDGVAAATLVGERLFVANEVATEDNGLYVVTNIGTAGTPFVLTRVADMNQDAEVGQGLFFLVLTGTLYAGSLWMLVTADPITLNTTGLSFIQAGFVTSITAGLDLDPVVAGLLNHKNVLTDAGGVAAAYPFPTSVTVNARGHITAIGPRTKHAEHSFTAVGAEAIIATGITGIIEFTDNLYVNGARYQPNAVPANYSLDRVTGILTLSTALVAGDVFEFRAQHSY